LAEARADAGDDAGGGDDACFGAAAAGWAGRCPFGDPVPGSAVMILTAGVEAELGNSALVGLPVGTDGGNPASGPAAAVGGWGAFQSGA